MSHNRKLGKPTDQRIAMLRAMTTYLLENGQIKTTVSRAKEVAPMAEKMITLAKNANLANYRKALSYLTKEPQAGRVFSLMGGGTGKVNLPLAFCRKLCYTTHQ